MRQQPLYTILATAIDAMKRCQATNNVEWCGRHEDTIIKMVERYLPNGSGFNNGTKFDFDASNRNKLIFTTAYHHMDEMGGYAGWTEHKVTIMPSFIHGYDLVISGRNRNGIKDYMAECFSVLGQMFAWDEAVKQYIPVKEN